ncbi:MAG: hypothetical protein GSR80_001202 [Desulfurococcales archaeon]|nr:hypothetical protein [Desulfurococcales archaeon]
MRAGLRLRSVLTRPTTAAWRLLSYSLDPKRYTPGVLKGLIVARASMLAAALALALAPIHTALRAALASGALALALFVDKAYDAIASSGIDDEVPSLLLYLLPYAWSTHTVADLIARLAESGSSAFKWIRREASRLKAMLDYGMDPLAALRELARTTPSRALRESLEEIIHASRLGYSRTMLLSSLVPRALNSIKRRWQSYSETAKVISEVNAAVIVSMGALAPITAFTGSWTGALYAVVLAPPLLALALALTQPSTGPGRASLPARLAPLGVASVTAFVAYARSVWAALALLGAAAAVGEVLGFRHSRMLSRALAALSRAAREARLGRPVDALLEDARPVDPPVIEAIIGSIRVAGLSRVWVGVEVLERVYREAKGAMDSLRGTAVLSLAVTLMSVLTAYYTIAMVSAMPEAAQMGPTLFRVNVGGVLSLLEAVAPLAGVPAGLLLRPQRPSLTPSLVLLASTALAPRLLGILHVA